MWCRVRLCSLVEKKGHVLHLFLWQRKATEARGACLRCLALTSMSRRFSQRRYDMRGGEGNASKHRSEERRMLRLLEITWDIFGNAGLNVITNGILWDSFLMEVLSAVLRGIWRTFSIASLTKRCLYPLFMRWIPRAFFAYQLPSPFTPAG